MQFSAVILAGLFFLCSPVFAEFVIITTTYRIQTSFKKAGDASKWISQKTQAINSALSTYSTHLVADPQYTANSAAIYSILATKSGIPSVVTASGTTTTIQSMPTWYTDMPSSLQSYFSSVQQDQLSIFTSIANQAPKPTGGAGMGRMAGAAAVGAIGAGALFF